MAHRKIQTLPGGRGASPADPNTAEGRYQALSLQRQHFLDRAREVAEVTIPSLMPPEGFGNGMKLYTPYQSVGSRGVNNLASKLLLALFPPGTPFFRLKPSEFDLNEFERVGMGASEIKDVRGRIEKVLGEIERSSVSEMELMGLRVTMVELLKQLIVAGNGLLRFLPKLQGVRLYQLDEYVVVRDNEGNVLEIIVQEELSPRTLPDPVREIVMGRVEDSIKEGSSDEKSVCLYTRIIRRRNKWVIYQEVEGQEVPDTRHTEPLDKPSWLPLRLTRLDRESYGRGLGEEVLGDLQSLESLTQSVVEYGAAASKILFMLDEAGTTDGDDLLAPSGSIVNGRREDVTVLSLDKFADMQFVFSLTKDITSRLELAFLLNTAVRRDAERVTAAEIHFIASELEETLGGVYSVLSQELQLPIVRKVLDLMKIMGKAPKLDERDVRPQIVTGLEALGRNRDLIRMEQLVAGTAQLFGPEEVSRWIKVGEFITRRATALGVDIDGVVRTEEEVNENDQAAAQQELIKQVAPQTVSQVGETVRANQQQGGSTRT